MKTQEELEVLWTIADRLVNCQKKKIAQQAALIEHLRMTIRSLEAGLKFIPNVGWVTEEEYRNSRG